MYKYYMLNKPSGCITAKRDISHKVVMEYMEGAEGENLSPVGRLDKDTEGLLFITNDGKWNQHLMCPKSHIMKTYYFAAMGILDGEKIEILKNGIELAKGTSKVSALSVEVIDNTILADVIDKYRGKRTAKLYKNKYSQPVTIGSISIAEGRKRQVKRMLKSVGCYIIYLKRTMIGTIRLDENLAPGEYRELTLEEVNSFVNI